MAQSIYPRVVLSLFVALLLFAAGNSARARTWTVVINLNVADFGTYNLADQVDIPAAGGSAKGAAIPGFSFNHNAQSRQVSFSIDTTVPVDAGCTVAARISGTAAVAGTYTLSAQGLTVSNTTITCPVAGRSTTYTLAVTGSFQAGSTVGAASVATVDLVSGDVQVRTASGSGPATSTLQIDQGTEIATGPNSTVTVHFADGSRLQIGPNSVFTLETEDANNNFFANLRKGAVQILSQLGGRRVQVRTGVIACACVRGTEYSVSYAESNGIGTTVVNVTSGTVDVVERNGNTVSVSAGGQRTITAAVNRVLTSLPVNEGRFTQGLSNLFGWSAYPGASAYLLEAVTSPPGFSQSNPSAAQPGTVQMIIPLSQLTVNNGSVEWSLNVPDGTVPAGTRVAWRVFPLGASNQLLPGTAASDSMVFTAH